MVAKFVNEALKDILKPKDKESIRQSVKTITNFRDKFVDALDDGDIELADMIYTEHNVSNGIISRFLDHAYISYIDNKITIEQLETSGPSEDAFGYEEPTEEELRIQYQELYRNNKKLKKAVEYLSTLDLPKLIKEKIEDFNEEAN